MREHFIIGSRGSKLALWQSEWVKARLAALRPETEIRIEVIKTSGDVMQSVPLATIGGKGVFTKELEEALLAEEIDLAVHSLKDLPTTLPDNLAITAITEREDARDALVLREDATATENNSLHGLPQNAVVGTSSLRRQAQLKHLRPDVVIKDLRGNVDTRLRKLDEGGYDAIILASAGLRRLGFERRINATIPHAEMLPAVGQGALGIETRANDARTISLVSLLEHAATRAACTAERALLYALGGGCQVPIAAHAVMSGDSSTLHLEALVAALDGKRLIRDSLKDNSAHAARAGETLAARLRERGAAELLEGLTV
ncbi:MAG TPA: hydroxymethylbilane synthase [Pyrinomonadaceae bacterium]|nr:hydroxymethylbilane synthase [Pyrinomonadaceae bacterium]